MTPFFIKHKLSERSVNEDVRKFMRGGRQRKVPSEAKTMSTSDTNLNTVLVTRKTKGM